MLIDIKTIKDIKGVIHVGAFMGEEKKIYDEMGLPVIWVEAQKDLCDRLISRGDRVINAAVSDKEFETTLKISSNGASTSILDFGTHADKYPNITVEKEIKITTTTLETIIDENEIDLSKFNFINIDIEGHGLAALRGLGEYVSAFKYLYMEVYKDELYKGCDIFGDLEKEFPQYKLQETAFTGRGWGDALYIKK